MDNHDPTTISVPVVRRKQTQASFFYQNVSGR
jgi:hypothetical protein